MEVMSLQSLAILHFLASTVPDLSAVAPCAQPHISYAGGHHVRKLLLAGAVAGLALTTPLAAQQRRGPSFGLTPYAGYMKFGSLVSGPLGTSLRNGGSASTAPRPRSV